MTRSGSPPEDETRDLEQRIAERTSELGTAVRAEVIPLLARHLAMTLGWGRSGSLTAIRDPAEAIDRHVVESIIAAEYVSPASGPLLDVGSGNGYPAVPIKCLHPAMRAVLLEPSLRRSVFLRQVVRRLALDGVEVRRERVDTPADLERYSPLGTITMRAVAVAATVAAGAVRALNPGGRVVLLVGADRAEEVVRRLPAGLAILERRPLPGRIHAQIVVLEKQDSLDE